MLVFAYGSNMHTARLRARVPSTVPVSMGVVAGRRFAFHKIGRDGSGKGDAYLTGDPDDRVWGVLFEIDAADKPVLDQYESVGVGYDDLTVAVQLAGGEAVEAVIYVARQQMINATLKPLCWYRQFVLQGGQQHGLPPEYLADLAQHEFVRDADAARREQNWLVSGIISD